MDERIEAITAFSAYKKCLVDIGSDHAYSAINAIKKYYVEKAYAVDIAEGPLLNAKKNILKNELSDRIELILSDGFDNVNVDFDCAIISGMGGLLIIDIMKRYLSKINENQTFILEANRDTDLLREFLFDNKFVITSEKCLYVKKHFYQIIVAKKEKEKVKYEKLDVLFGPILRKEKSEDFIKFYTNILKKRKENLKKANQKEKILNEISDLTEMLGE